jgi:hypothetical protein
MRRAAWIRALRGLGFFVSAGVLGACASADPHVRASAVDAQYRTGAFTWLVDHDPARVVVWRVPPAQVAQLIPDAQVLAARTDAPCGQARTAHAALLLVAPRSARALRDRAEDCGFALFRDDGALVIAPLPR